MSLLFLYLEFFKIGLFAAGGGLATLPFLFHLANDHSVFIRRTNWFNTGQIGNFIAIAQCAPGAIGANIAVQTGFLYGGLNGGLIAVLGLISPAIIIISIITRVLQSFKENKVFASVFSGFRPAAAGLLCAAGWGVLKLSLYNPNNEVWYSIIRWREGLICAVLFVLIIKLKTHPIIFIALGAIVGIIFRLQ